MNTDKQPQTVYVPFDLNSERVLSYSGKKIENVYLYTTEELEALINEKCRFAASEVFQKFVDAFVEDLNKEFYLNKHYPLPQPSKP